MQIFFFLKKKDSISDDSLAEDITPFGDNKKETVKEEVIELIIPLQIIFMDQTEEISSNAKRTPENSKITRILKKNRLEKVKNNQRGPLPPPPHFFFFTSYWSSENAGKTRACSDRHKLSFVAIVSERSEDSRADPLVVVEMEKLGLKLAYSRADVTSDENHRAFDSDVDPGRLGGPCSDKFDDEGL